MSKRVTNIQSGMKAFDVHEQALDESKRRLIKSEPCGHCQPGLETKTTLYDQSSRFLTICGNGFLRKHSTLNITADKQTPLQYQYPED